MKAQNEAESLHHMKVAFRAGGGQLSARLKGWTAIKREAVNAMMVDAEVSGMFTRADLAERGILDVGIGDQAVVAALFSQLGHVSYTGVEGEGTIAKAARARMQSWKGPTTLLEIPFSEFVATDLGLQPAIVLALDVLYHIPEDDLYDDLVETIFGLGAAYVIVSFATDMTQTFNQAKGPGGPGFSWFPRPFVPPPGWVEVFAEDSRDGVQKQRVVVYRNGNPSCG